ncbi:MAG: hypothetical protein ABIR80_21075 [Opitutaceae bacterium]
MDDGESNENSPLAVVVIATADKRFVAVDIMDASWFRGELQPLWEELLVGLACEQESHGSAPTSEDLQTLSEEIRYQHELITSEETESWLTRRKLSLDDLTDYCRRRYWRDHTANPPPGEKIDYLDATSELRELFLKGVLFAGKFDEWVRRLAWRVAASLAAEVEPPASADKLDAQRALFFQWSHLEPETLAGALQQIGRDREWFEALIEMETCYRWHCDQVCTAENRGRSLVALRLPLTQFTLEILDLESEDVAREARFCLETDGLSMAEFAAQEHYRIERGELLLEDFPEELQPRFLASETGRFHHVTTSDNCYQVCRLLEKREPTLADENVVRRIDRELLETHFENLVAKNSVRLVEPGSPP